MCDVEYTSLDIDEYTGNCTCFLYDAHDPTSCAMGLVYLSSNFGGGQDPWLWTSFFLAVVFSVGLWQAKKASAAESEKKVTLLSLGNQIFFHEKTWGQLFLGIAIYGMFIANFISRFIFAFAEPNISRNANVIINSIFQLMTILVAIGVGNCWFSWQFHIYRVKAVEKGENESELATPYPGLFRKTAHLLGLTVSGKQATRTVAHYVTLVIEACVAISALLFVSMAITLAARASQRVDGSKAHKAYLSAAFFFTICFLLSCLDVVLAVIVHRYFGLSLWLKARRSVSHSDKEMPKSTPGLEQSPLKHRDLVLVLGTFVSLILAQSLILRLLGGWCPYIPPEQDIYHGGDPAEAAQADLAYFMMFLFLSVLVLRHVYAHSEALWKPYSDLDVNQPRPVEPAAHPKEGLLLLWSSIVSSVSELLISIAIVIMDYNYKYDAGMIGRILYFIGYMFAISVFDDRKLFLVVLDGRYKSAIPLRILALILGLYVFFSYLSLMVFWLKNPDGMNVGMSDVPAFDTYLFISSLAAFVVKYLIVLGYQRLIVKKYREGQKSDEPVQQQQQESQQGSIEMSRVNGEDNSYAGLDEVALQDAPVSSSQESLERAVNGQDQAQTSLLQMRLHGAGFFLRVFDDIAALVSGMFKYWVVIAIIWNALGLLLFLGLVGLFISKELRRHWCKGLEKELNTDEPPSRLVLGPKRAAFKCFAQIFGAFTMFWITQMFYFLTSPLPYYEPQILVAGHRGVWTKGYAENSFEAFDFAKSKRYHAVEVDMRMTKDQQLVVMHDLTLQRTTNATGNVFDFDLDWLQNNVRLKKEGTDEIISEYPYDMNEIIQGAVNRDLILNIEVKQDKNLSAIPLALDAICRNNATQNSFISTGDTRFQHLLYYMQPNITLEKDFLLYTPTMSLMVPFNVNIYAISAELLLFNTWVIPNAHAAGLMVLVYFLAIETPGMINYFVALGVDGFMLNNPDDCYDSGVCYPGKNFTLPRTM